MYILASNFPDMKKLINTYYLGSYIKPNYEELIKKIKFFEVHRKKIKIKKRNIMNLSWKKQSKNLVYGYKRIFKH